MGKAAAAKEKKAKVAKEKKTKKKNKNEAKGIRLGKACCKRNVPAATYSFKALKTPPGIRHGDYSRYMRDQCKKYKMKPVCDKASYCKNDARSLYLGTDDHLSYKPNWADRNKKYQPKGLFSKLRKFFAQRCFYTNRKFGQCWPKKDQADPETGSITQENIHVWSQIVKIENGKRSRKRMRMQHPAYHHPLC